MSHNHHLLYIYTGRFCSRKILNAEKVLQIFQSFAQIRKWSRENISYSRLFDEPKKGPKVLLEVLR